jgi:hypothetical protein
MMLVDQSKERVRAAVARFGKKPLADKAGLTDSIVRNAHDQGWDPRSTTLRSLEVAAAELEREHGNAKAKSRTEHPRKNPGAKARATQ